MLEAAYRIVLANVENVTLTEALFVPSGGYRSILGTLKHIAGWSHIYRSYAFDAQPQHWQDIAWPYGRRDTIIPNDEYFAALLNWFTEAHNLWLKDLQPLSADQLDEPHPLHWGETAPLWEIVDMIARHHVYHAGELNQVLSICRGEAWEEGEEVEENHISTVGHRVRPPWLVNDDH
jgi:hypothetical protein